MHKKHIFTIFLVCLVFTGIFWLANTTSLLAAYDSTDKIISDVIQQNTLSDFDETRFFLPENDYINIPKKTSEEPAPSITAKAYLVLDPISKQIIVASGTKDVLPIASITKLITAFVFLDLSPDLNETYIVKREDHVSGGRVNVFYGDEVKYIDLLNLALIASDNTAANCLVSATGVGEEQFVKLMNKKAWELGIANTRFSDPIGLSHENVATTKDVAYLLGYAWANEVISQIIKKESFSFKTVQGRSRYVKSTNFLLTSQQSDIISLGGKTGFNEAANFCFTGVFDKDDKKLITVVLGDTDPYSRIDNALELAKWSYDNFIWQ